MATTAMVHVRVDEQLKAKANETLALMGLSVSDAVRVFLMRVVADRQMPFAIKSPNAETLAAMAEADEIARKRSARFGTLAGLKPRSRNRTGRIASQPAPHLGSSDLVTAPGKGAPPRPPNQFAVRSGRATSLSIAGSRLNGDLEKNSRK
jgi:DNA-damage-inducible protein J